MRSTEASGTPATTRKRARNQTSAAGSLSLLAVPKLKVSDPAAPPAAEPSQLARPKESAKQHIGAHKPLSKSPRQHMKTADTAVHGGKENRPVTNTQPALANAAKLPVRQALSNKPALVIGIRPEPKHKLPAAITGAKTAESHSTIQETLPAPVTSNRLSPSLQHSDNLHGPSATSWQHVTAGDLHSAMPDPNPVEQQQAGCSGITDSPAVYTERDQAFLSQGVPLACHTAINKRRRPVGQATRYGEWYTGNDTDLDEQLLEYNAEQARAASAAGLQLERRKSDLASYAADKDDANSTDEEAAEATHKQSSRLRRSTIAPGQDTAAQVAAMTAELNRLADDMLPKEEDQRGKKHKQDSQQHKDLRERLLESWDGKTYYERLQAEAEQPPEAKSSDAGDGVVQESKQPAEVQGDVRAGGLKSQSSHPQRASPSSKGLSRKGRSGALTPNASKGKLSRVQSPSRESVIMSPELLGSSEARQKASKQEQDRVQAGSSPLPSSGRTDSPHRKEGAPTVPPGQPAGRAAARKRLPPLPLSARGASQGAKPTAATRHAAQPAGNPSKQQQQHKSSRSEKAPESQRCMPADKGVSNDAAANRNAPAYKAADLGTSECQHHQQNQQQLAGNMKQAGVPQGAQQGERQGCMGSSDNKMQRSLTTSQSEQASVNGAAVPVSAAQAQQQPAPSSGRSAPAASASLPAHSSPCAILSIQTGESNKVSAGSAAEHVGMSGVQQGEAGHRGGQQQVARLTASNTALLAELVDLQAAKALLEEQLAQEQNLRLAAEASKEILSQQLAERQSALATAKQQVCDLQSPVANLPATARQAGSSGALQSSADTATLEESLRAVKHHAAALAEAAATLESLKL